MSTMVEAPISRSRTRDDPAIARSTVSPTCAADGGAVGQNKTVGSVRPRIALSAVRPPIRPLSYTGASYVGPYLTRISAVLPSPGRPVTCIPSTSCPSTSFLSSGSNCSHTPGRSRSAFWTPASAASCSDCVLSFSFAPPAAECLRLGNAYPTVLWRAGFLVVLRGYSPRGRGRDLRGGTASCMLK